MEQLAQTNTAAYLHLTMDNPKHMDICTTGMMQDCSLSLISHGCQAAQYWAVLAAEPRSIA